MVIHFPIALLIAGYLSALIALFSKKQFFGNASLYLLILGTLGAIVAYVSGNYAGDGMTDSLIQEPLELHEDAALVTLVLSIITVVFYAALYFYKYEKAWSKWTGIIVFSGLIGFVARTGYLGGELVFKHGAGIELALPDFGE